MTTIKTTIDKCDYAILHTGYTSRIPELFEDDEFISEINTNLNYGFTTNENKHLVCIKDYLWGKYNDCEFVLYGNQEDYEFVNSMVDDDGYILLKDIDLQGIFLILDYFNDLDEKFCNFCCASKVYKIIHHITPNGKTIMQVFVDTESG